jgi:hypothetical protein
VQSICLLWFLQVPDATIAPLVPNSLLQYPQFAGFHTQAPVNAIHEVAEHNPAPLMPQWFFSDILLHFSASGLVVSVAKQYPQLARTSRIRASTCSERHIRARMLRDSSC